MAMGERTPVALLDAAAAARMAVAEAVTNIASAPIERLAHVRLSANWMAAAGHPGEDARLYDAVRAVGAELCPALGIAIPVGKDSMSMRATWDQKGESRAVVSPVSLIVTAFAPVVDARRALTPELRSDAGDTELLLIDLGRGRLGASALCQVYEAIGSVPPDLDDPPQLASMFAGVQELSREGLVLAYHDRSDGGLAATLVEMAFAGGVGIDVELPSGEGSDAAALFNEELGAVLQVRVADTERALAILAKHGLGDEVHRIGELRGDDRVRVTRTGRMLCDRSRTELRAAWSETTHRMQTLRDDPACAAEEQAQRCDPKDPGLSVVTTFDPALDITASLALGGARPRMAILREQGVNGHVEMAAAFDRAGFEGMRDEFQQFFERTNTFALGVCNGCQMLSNLHELIPGAANWPHFVRNRSEQFESRLSLIQVEESPSILLAGMAGSRLPIAVAHGEGRAETASDEQRAALEPLVAARFVDNHGEATEAYPANPNGSPDGMTALTTEDGRVTIMMPHPERVFRAVQYSWRPRSWGEDAPWMRLFRNARAWVG